LSGGKNLNQNRNKIAKECVELTGYLRSNEELMLQTPQRTTIEKDFCGNSEKKEEFEAKCSNF
jgi:hypothetical protein